MGFYNLSKEQREDLVKKIHNELLKDFDSKALKLLWKYFSDEDTYIRKTAYLSVSKIYKERQGLHKTIITTLWKLFEEEDYRVRQTVINSAGEIGIQDFETAEKFLEAGLSDSHHSVRNAVIGSLKKTGQKNPKPSLQWAKKFLHHPDKEIRREICHGIELRGRTHPEDILPLLKELEYDKTARVRNTLVHVIGQISYKKDCLEKVLHHLQNWENKKLVQDALDEIIDVHDRYKDFAVLSQKEVKKIIKNRFTI